LEDSYREEEEEANALTSIDIIYTEMHYNAILKAAVKKTLFFLWRTKT